MVKVKKDNTINFCQALKIVVVLMTKEFFQFFQIFVRKKIQDIKYIVECTCTLKISLNLN